MTVLLDPVKNFAVVTVFGLHTAGDTAIPLNTSEGVKLPDPVGDGDFNLVWWDATVYPNPSDDPNKEVVRATLKVGDTITVTRNQESSGASTKNTPGSTYKMMVTMTKKTYDEIDASLLTTVQLADLTDAGDSTLHYHASDRDRDNHTNTQTTATLNQTGTAGETLAAGDYVYRRSSTGKYHKADKDVTAQAESWNIVGVIVTGGILNDPIKYQPLVGEYTTSGLTSGATYYLGAAGAITSTHPAVDDPDIIPIKVGDAVSTTKIQFDRQRIKRRVIKGSGIGGVGVDTITVGFPIGFVEAHAGVQFKHTTSGGFYDAVSGVQLTPGGGGAILLIIGELSGTAAATASLNGLDLDLTWAYTISPAYAINYVLHIEEKI